MSKPVSQNHLLTTQAANTTKQELDTEISRLQTAWGIEYDSRSPDMMLRATNNLQSLLEEAGLAWNEETGKFDARRILDVSSDVNNIEALTTDIIAAQKEVIFALKHQRIYYLKQISENYENISKAASAGNEDEVVKYKKDLEQNFAALQNMPDIQEYFGNIKGLEELAEIQNSINNSPGKTDEVLFRKSAASIVSGLANCHKIADGFVKDPTVKRADNYGLQDTGKEVLGYHEKMVMILIAPLQEQLKSSTAKLSVNADSRMSQIDSEIYKLKTERSTFETQAALKSSLENQLKLQQEVLQGLQKQTKPSFLTVLTFGIYKSKKVDNKTANDIANTQREIAIIANRLQKIDPVVMKADSGKATIEDYANKIAAKTNEKKQEESNVTSLTAQISALEPLSKATIKTVIGKENNTALHKKVGDSLTDLSTKFAVAEQRYHISEIKAQQTTSTFKEKFAKSFRDQLDLARLCHEGVAQSTVVDVKTKAIGAVNAAAGYVPVPGVSYGVSLLMRGAQYMVDKEKKRANATISNKDVEKMSEIIRIVSEKLAESHLSQLENITTEKGINSLAEFAVQKVIAEMSKKNSRINITPDMDPEGAADMIIAEIHNSKKTKADKVKGVVAKAERGQYSSTVNNKGWKAQGFFENCGIITEDGQKFVPADSDSKKINYGFRKGTTAEVAKLGFKSFTENKTAGVVPKSNEEIQQDLSAIETRKTQLHGAIENSTSQIAQYVKSALPSQNADQISGKVNKILHFYRSYSIDSSKSAKAKDENLRALVEAEIGKDKTLKPLVDNICEHVKILSQSVGELKGIDNAAESNMFRDWDKKYPKSAKLEAKLAESEAKSPEAKSLIDVKEQANKDAATGKVMASVKELEDAIREHFLKYPKTSGQNSCNTAQEAMANIFGSAQSSVDKVGMTTGNYNPFSLKALKEDLEKFKNLEALDKGKFFMRNDATKEHFHEVADKFNVLKHNLYEAKKLGIEIDVATPYKKLNQEAKSAGTSTEIKNQNSKPSPTTKAKNSEDKNSEQKPPSKRRHSVREGLVAAVVAGGSVMAATGSISMGLSVGGALGASSLVFNGKSESNTKSKNKDEDAKEGSGEQREILGKHTARVINAEKSQEQKTQASPGHN